MSLGGLGRLALLPMLKQVAGLMGGGGFAGAAKHFEETSALLARTIVDGRAGGDLVHVTCTAQRIVKSVKIDPQAFKMDKGVLEDLLKTAVNEALSNAEEAERRAYDAATEKLKAELPGMMSGLLGGMGGGKKP